MQSPSDERGLFEQQQKDWYDRSRRLRIGGEEFIKVIGRMIGFYLARMWASTLGRREAIGEFCDKELCAWSSILRAHSSYSVKNSVEGKGNQ